MWPNDQEFRRLKLEPMDAAEATGGGGGGGTGEIDPEEWLRRTRRRVRKLRRERRRLLKLLYGEEQEEQEEEGAQSGVGELGWGGSVRVPGALDDEVLGEGDHAADEVVPGGGEGTVAWAVCDLCGRCVHVFAHVLAVCVRAGLRSQRDCVNAV